MSLQDITMGIQCQEFTVPLTFDVLLLLLLCCCFFDDHFYYYYLVYYLSFNLSNSVFYMAFNCYCFVCISIAVKLSIIWLHMTNNLCYYMIIYHFSYYIKYITVTCCFIWASVDVNF